MNCRTFTPNPRMRGKSHHAQMRHHSFDCHYPPVLDHFLSVAEGARIETAILKAARYEVLLVVSCHLRREVGEGGGGRFTPRRRRQVDHTCVRVKNVPRPNIR